MSDPDQTLKKIISSIKGTVQRFYTVEPSDEYGLLEPIFSTPVAAIVELMFSWIGPKWSTSNSNDRIGLIRDTYKIDRSKKK